MTSLAHIFAGSPSFAKVVSELSEKLPLITQLVNTPQEADWHAEGDVAAHSTLVLEQALSLADTANLLHEQRTTLLAAAALHDIGKALTTRQEIDAHGTLRWRSRLHARRGRDYLGYRLLGMAPAKQIWQILQLVGEHHSLHLAIDRSRGIWALARRANLSLLLLLAKADARGRIVRQSFNERRLSGEELVEFVELLAAEEGLDLSIATSSGYQQPDHYAHFCKQIAQLLLSAPPQLIDLACGRGIRDWEAGLIHTPHEAVARVQGAIRQGFGRLTLLCGPSGSGKSSYAKQLQRESPNARIISLDSLRASLGKNASDQKVNGQVLQAARQALREGLRQHQHVIWDATSLRRQQRAQLVTLAHDYGALSEIVLLWTSPKLLQKRNMSRQRVVNAAIVAKQLAALEFPEVSEAHVVRYLENF